MIFGESISIFCLSLTNTLLLLLLKPAYCKINFCQVRDLYSIINIKSTESFYLDKNITIVDGNLDKLLVRDSFNGMTIIIPKKKEKLKINYSNIVKSALNLDGFYISEGIKLEDITNKEMEYEKISDAISGYYNNRNRWIPY